MRDQTAMSAFIPGIDDDGHPQACPTRRSSDLGEKRPAVRQRDRKNHSQRRTVQKRGLFLRSIYLRQAQAHDQGKKRDRKSTRLNSSHLVNSYAASCLKKKKV